ncbi:hypothetical protein Tco_0544222 [Tanacetum coccineum]
MRALYSSHIACFQLGSCRAWNGELGIEEEVVTWKLYFGLAFTVPTLKRVTIGCFEEVGRNGGGGGGGGVTVVSVLFVVMVLIAELEVLFVGLFVEEK